MFRRSFCIAFIAFQFVWLNVIIPGHTRGAVTMPCCSSCASAESCPHCHTNNPPRVPTSSDREHCALCCFAAHLSIPPTLDLSAPRLMFLSYVGAERATHLLARSVLVPFDGRGPPHFA